MPIHAANLRTSRRLQRLNALLVSVGEQGVTTWDICNTLGILNPATHISMLRFNGVDVDCRYEGLSEHGAKIYRYRLS